MKRATLATTVFLLFVLVGFVSAQATKPADAPKAPELTTEQKLTIENLTLKITLAQSAAREAQANFDKSVADIQKLIAALQVPGYDLDVQKLAYTPKPAPVPEKK